MEIWKDIKGFEGYYQVSNYGRVKSLKRVIIRSNGINQSFKEKILKPILNNKGYYRVTLHKNGKQKLREIHQFVAIAFLNHEPCGFELVVNHKDINKLNNNISNLEIVTNRENSNQKHIKSSSQYTGVVWHKASKKWRSQIRFNGKLIELGYFTDEFEASEYYENALISIKNGQEIKCKKANFTSNYKGVCWSKSAKKWKTHIRINGKLKHLGYFINEYDAHLAYQNELGKIN